VRVILDSNVVMSGIFFGGVPGQILTAWRSRRVKLVLSPTILAEYRRVGMILAAQYSEVDFEPFATLLATNSEIVDAPEFSIQVSKDPDDDSAVDDGCWLAVSAAGRTDLSHLLQRPLRQQRF
jgi:predicted nucleic acid-binding protein